ncbi:hypothetical protein RM844_28615 [Streptomyces sp. DSM 44915]|uniref:Uncharacterized protein n=1 Tax=Streptomyces chisholmiae TaxID=3075540 RepID=A0ABU2JZ06_9ACTN|nr:hypothetical protein [Streptomyces sp. DSM 44915]MDT0270240.1 hypothetical protein [Streptomyces sp. DSM 44915]
MTRPEWMPTEAAGVDVLPAGQWWDAVRLPLGRGMDLVAAMGTSSGQAPAIRNLVTITLTWLVPVGSAAGWPGWPGWPGWVEIVTTGRRLAVPAAELVHEPWDGGPAVSWHSRPAGDALTDVSVLQAAVDRQMRGLIP